MNRDDVIKLAREAGIHVYPEFECAFERFADLVAEHVKSNIRPPSCRDAILRAREEEREACAQVCDRRYMGDNTREDMEARRCAEAIRAKKD